MSDEMEADSIISDIENVLEAGETYMTDEMISEEVNLEDFGNVDQSLGIESETILGDENLQDDGDLINSFIEKESELLEETGASETEPSEKKTKKEESTKYRPLNLPLARIKQIIKMDPDVTMAGSEAVFLIGKATELFIQTLSKEAYAMTVASKKKTMQKKDVDAAIASADPLVFLDGAMDF